MTKKFYKKDTIKELEELKERFETAGNFMVWRITESTHWYNIELEEDDGVCGEKIAFYKTDSYDELIEFCGTHCNPGYNNIYGLGMVDDELVDATDRYIEELKKK